MEIELNTKNGNIKSAVILVTLIKHYKELKRTGSTVQFTVELRKIYETNLERSYGHLKQWPSDYCKFWYDIIMEVRFK